MSYAAQRQFWPWQLLLCLDSPDHTVDTAAAAEHMPLSPLSVGRIEAAAAVLILSLAFLPHGALP